MALEQDKNGTGCLDAAANAAYGATIAPMGAQNKNWNFLEEESCLAGPKGIAFLSPEGQKMELVRKHCRKLGLEETADYFLAKKTALVKAVETAALVQLRAVVVSGENWDPHFVCPVDVPNVYSSRWYVDGVAVDGVGGPWGQALGKTLFREANRLLAEVKPGETMGQPNPHPLETYENLRHLSLFLHSNNHLQGYFAIAHD
jgi:hypothetical protein